VQLWCDAYGDHALDGRDVDPAVPVQLGFVEPDGGRVVDADAPVVRPEYAWAGRLVAARVAGDRDMFQAIGRSVPATQDGRYLGALVVCIGLTMRTLPRGFALPDRVGGDAP
jgi:hypothetical protein